MQAEGIEFKGSDQKKKLVVFCESLQTQQAEASFYVENFREKKQSINQ